jgi:ribonuclease HI
MAPVKKSSAAWILYTDGASKGNPGPAGAGWVLKDVAKGKTYREGSFLGEATNNEAEYQALILGLQRALEYGAADLAIYLDSELLVRQLNGVYRVKNPRLLAYYRRVQELLKKFATYAIIHIPREANEEADRMANEALKNSNPFRAQGSE